jgi:hypothetical protein
MYAPLIISSINKLLKLINYSAMVQTTPDIK